MVSVRLVWVQFGLVWTLVGFKSPVDWPHTPDAPAPTLEVLESQARPITARAAVTVTSGTFSPRLFLFGSVLF